MSTFYVCRHNHPNDRICAENVLEFMGRRGVDCRLIELGSDSYRPQLQQCLRDPDAIGVLGFNWQLDHSWSAAGRSFLDEAAERQLPVLQWIFDHASARWPEFTKSTATNSAYLFLSAHNESYFRRFILPDARTGSTFGSGPSRRSRIEDLSDKSFGERDIRCLIPFNFRRIGGTIDGVQQRLQALRTSQPMLHDAVLTAIDAARFDLTYGTEDHLLPALAARGLAPPLALLNLCIQIVDEATQAWRRRRVVEVARAFSVVIDTDVEMPELETGASATFRHESSMPATLARMRSCRAVVSVSNLSDLMHNRTLNGLNAGCVNIVEDNVVHRRVFKHGVNALLFRYHDDSLRDCLELVCNDRQQAYRIAAEGFALRDCRPFRFGGFERILSLAHGRERVARQPDALEDGLFHVKQSGASAPAGTAWRTNAQRPSVF